MDTALTVITAVAGLPPALLYLVIVAWLVAESCGVPLPNEAILLFSGFLVGSGHLSLPLAWVASVAGTVGGASISWWLARTYGPAGVHRVGRYLLLTEGRLQAAEAFFRRRGPRTVFLARLVPVVRTVISYPAGLAQMRYGPFVAATAAGCAIWNLGILFVGRLAGERWSELFQRIHIPVLLAGAAVILAGAGYVLIEHGLRKRLAQARNRSELSR